MLFINHLTILFFTTVHQNTVIIAFSVDFHSQVSCSFHLICIITITVASQHLPVQLFFFLVFISPRRQETQSSSANAKFRLVSKVLQHNTLTSVQCPVAMYAAITTTDFTFTMGQSALRCTRQQLNVRIHLIEIKKWDFNKKKKSSTSPTETLYIHYAYPYLSLLLHVHSTYISG